MKLMRRLLGWLTRLVVVVTVTGVLTVLALSPRLYDGSTGWL